MKISQYINLSQVINARRPIDYWRRTVFVARALYNHKQMANFIEFFQTNSRLLKIPTVHSFIFEQLIRQWFFYHSTFRERAVLIKAHALFFCSKFTEPAFQSIYFGEGITLWTQKFRNDILSLRLTSHRYLKKEGLMSAILSLGNKCVYQITFWVALDNNRNWVLFIGALQGGKGGLKINHDLTKHFFGYRPKNMILFAVRTIAQYLDIKRIYAVSNHGYYTNNHFRLDRKLKTSLDDFWQEAGGKVCSDLRFFEIPLHESRKSLNEVASSKRNLYRKRFSMIDEFHDTLIHSLENCFTNYNIIEMEKIEPCLYPIGQ